MKVAVVGATGLVGSKMLEVLEERRFPVTELIPVASEKSAGKKVKFMGKEWNVVTPQEAITKKPQIALFSAGSTVSEIWGPKFVEASCRVIDNSSFWRMNPNNKLVIPEVNAHVVTREDMLIANPNCSTIQMLVALAPLHRKYKIKRIVVSTYQSVTGTGQKAISQLIGERMESCCNTKKDFDPVYKYPIDLNLIPQIDSFTDNGYTKEELKMVNETHKMLEDYSIAVSATTVRVPVMGGHSESVNVEFETDYELSDIFEILAQSKGIIVQDNIAECIYPMPLYAFGKDEVFVGRIRRDLYVKKALNMWVVSDNLRKGAATNAVQIAELILEKGFVVA